MTTKKNLPLDIQEAASQGNAVLGIRDSGKSYTATYMAERMMDAGVPIIAFDPIGIWRFLRVPGTGKGYPVVVAGGEHGDLPLTPEGAPEIVRAAMRDGVSLVLDLYSMALSKADWKRIVQKSLQVLLYENKAHGLRHVFIEEAAEFCPQRVAADQGHVYAEVEKLARMGGNAMLGYTLINQRAEEVNKAVLELCDNLFLHRQKGRNSLTALSKWLDVGDAKGGRAVIASLPTLPQGTAWLWAAGTDTPVEVKVPTKRTFHPDRRAMRGAAAEAHKAAVDVGSFVEHMKGSLAQIVAEAKENDPKTLKARIRELEKERTVERAHPLIQIDQQAVEAARQEGYQTGFKAGAEAITAAMRRIQDQFRVALGEMDNLAVPLPSAPAPKPLQRPTASAKPPAPQRPAPATNGSANLASGERKILTALAQYPDGRSKRQVAILSGYAINGGGFNNYLSALRSKGLMEGRGEDLRITPAGLEALGPYDPLPSGQALLEHWLGQLDKAPRAILSALAESYPSALSKDEVAARAGYEPGGGGFNNALSRLRTLELIEGRGDMRASADLF